jgi:hypothetical protein
MRGLLLALLLVTGKPSLEPATIAGVLLDRHFLPLTPQNVKAKLAALAELQSTPPVAAGEEEEWVWVSAAGEKPAIKVGFIKEDKAWTFSYLRVRLYAPPEKLPGLYQSVVAQFKKKLRRRGDAPRPRERAIYWDFEKEGLQLGIEEERDDPRVEVSFLVPSGESEN